MFDVSFYGLLQKFTLLFKTKANTDKQYFHYCNVYKMAQVVDATYDGYKFRLEPSVR